MHNKQIANTQSIATEFHRFYKALYNIQSSSSSTRDRRRVEEIREYFKDSAMPVLPPTVIEQIERPITTKELGKVVAALPMGKSPGPDGLTNAYYKKCISTLAFPLCRYFNTITA